MTGQPPSSRAQPFGFPIANPGLVALLEPFVVVAPFNRPMLELAPYGWRIPAGNVIDPLVIIDEFGADALRFTNTAMASIGGVLKLSTDRIKGYRNFGTKLWNAFSFADHYEVPFQPENTRPDAQNTLNKWIIGEVARVRGTTGPSGVFLDKIGHYTTEALIPIALGFRAAGELNIANPWAYAGVLLAVILLWNKALNDMAEATRYAAELPKLADTRENAAPETGVVATLRRAVRFFPFHRIYHSVEMTLIILAAALLDLVLGDLVATRGLLLLLLPLSLLATVGHALAIVSSRRLR